MDLISGGRPRLDLLRNFYHGQPMSLSGFLARCVDTARHVCVSCGDLCARGGRRSSGPAAGASDSSTRPTDSSDPFCLPCNSDRRLRPQPLGFERPVGDGLDGRFTLLDVTISESTVEDSRRKARSRSSWARQRTTPAASVCPGYRFAVAFFRSPSEDATPKASDWPGAIQRRERSLKP